MTKGVDRWAALGCLIASIVWLAIWRHQQLAHGMTQDNEMNLVGGLTWMDSGKFVVLPLLLVFAGLVILHRRREAPGARVRVGALCTFTTLGLLALATMVEFWIFPWGSYERTFEAAAGLLGSNASGGIQAIVSIAFGLSLVFFCLDLTAARVLPVWAAVMIPLGGLATVFLSPSVWFPAVAWLVLAVVLWLRRPLPAELA